MFKFRFLLLFAILFLFAACTADQAEPIIATRPAAVATSAPDTPTPFSSTTPVLTPFATELPTFPTPPVLNDGLDPFVSQLQRFLVDPDYDYMQATMSDPIAVGAWRSEWRMYEPAQVIAEFQNGSLPAPLAVQFTDLSLDELTELLGQPPATMFGPTVNVVAVLHSSGWGQSTSDEAILFITEEEDRYAWSGFLYTNGRFADASLGTVSAPVGLIYIVWGEGLYQIQLDGQRRQLLDAEDATIPNLRVAPDGRHVAYVNDEQKQLWIIDTATGEHQQYATDVTPSGYLQWGDKNTLFVGIWLDPSEGDGPNNGHMATLNVNNGDLQILDEEHLSSGRPSYLSDYTWAAFDVFPSGQDDVLTGRTYHPDSGLQIFDQTAYEGSSGNAIFNPAWSPDPSKIAWLTGDGERRLLQVFDVEAQTAVTLLDWDPARFGALIPSPIWSPDGQWLVLEVWANGPEGSGLWLLAADGSSQHLIDAEGKEPHWLDSNLLVYGVNEGPRLYDVASDMILPMDLPAGSWVLDFTQPDDLQSAGDTIRVTETAVPYVTAIQDVTIYSGPNESYEVVGSIFDGQTARVTGAGFDNNWWRVICPDDTIGDCWVTGDMEFVVPVETADPLTTPPDPSDVEMTTTTSDSPNGRWQASVSLSEPVLVLQSDQFYNLLTVSDGTTTWTPVDEWRGYGLGALSVAVFQWSQDGRYLYYTDYGSPDGCAIYTNGSNLHRLNLNNGTVAEILPLGKTGNLSLSPDESTLAYTSYNGQAELFVVQDLATSTERTVLITNPGEDAQTAKIFWSADGETAVLTLVYDPCLPTQTSSILRININALTATPLIEKDERLFRIQEWPNPAQPQIRLTDKDGLTWLLNIESGDITAE